MKKDFMDMLNEPDEAVMEELAESSPLPDGRMKKRIVENCMRKTASGAADEEDYAGGTDVIRRPRWTGLAAAAAAFALVIAGGAGVVMLGRNMKNTAPMTVESSSDTITAPAAAAIEEPATTHDLKSSGTEADTAGTKQTVTAYVAGANETSTVTVKGQDEVTGEEDDQSGKATEPVNSGSQENEASTESEKELHSSDAPDLTEPDIPSTTAPADDPSKINTGSDQQIHFPNTPNNDPGPSAYFLGTFYWNSTGSLGNMSWSFSAGANAGQQGSSGGVGQCVKDGDYFGDFSYTASNGQITITWTSGKLACTGMQGTISGILYNSTAPFDIVWNSGGTDHFTFNSTGDLGIKTYEPYFVNED